MVASGIPLPYGEAPVGRACLTYFPSLPFASKRGVKTNRGHFPGLSTSSNFGSPLFSSIFGTFQNDGSAQTTGSICGTYQDYISQQDAADNQQEQVADQGSSVAPSGEDGAVESEPPVEQGVEQGPAEIGGGGSGGGHSTPPGSHLREIIVVALLIVVVANNFL